MNQKTTYESDIIHYIGEVVTILTLASAATFAICAAEKLNSKQSSLCGHQRDKREQLSNSKTNSNYAKPTF